MKLDEVNRRRVAQLMRLLDSDKDGEAIAAVRGVARALGRCGAKWADIAQMFEAHSQSRQQSHERRRDAPRDDVRSVVAHCIEHMDAICTDWECEFLESVAEQLDDGHMMSPKQLGVIEKIKRKVDEYMRYSA